MNDNEWKNRAKGLLKAEIARKNISLTELSKRLKSIGVNESPQNISNKINRGSFSAIFMLQVLQVLECTGLSLSLK